MVFCVCQFANRNVVKGSSNIPSNFVGINDVNTQSKNTFNYLPRKKKQKQVFVTYFFVMYKKRFFLFTNFPQSKIKGDRNMSTILKK